MWVPVDNQSVTLSRKDFSKEPIVSIGKNKVIDRIYYSEESRYSCLYKYEQQESQYSIEYFKKSVKEYGGFYIARYETGVNIQETSDVQEECKIQANLFPYINITRDEALNKSMEMYSTNQDVVSSLVNSFAWDTALQFINNTIPNYYSRTDNVNTGELKNTGKNNDMACNIYDLSGNVKEWSTEYSSNGYYSYLSSCVVRGGYYSNSNFTAASRYYNGEDVKNEYIGFRIILYIK